MSYATSSAGEFAEKCDWDTQWLGYATSPAGDVAGKKVVGSGWENGFVFVIEIGGNLFSLLGKGLIEIENELFSATNQGL